jgi:hypothetical protein
VTEPPPPPAELPPTPPPVRAKKQKRRKKPGQRTIWTYLFYLVITVILLFGLLQAALSIFGDKEPAIGDHIHAALAVNVCGANQGSAPEFLKRAGSDESAGVHAHTNPETGDGDGLMHVHPEADDEVGANATVGKFFEEGGWELSEDRINLSNGWADIDVSNGDPCPDGRPGTVRLLVNGVEQEGDPADYAPDDGDRIVILFLAEGDALPTDEGSLFPDGVLNTLATALDGKSVDQEQVEQQQEE